MVILILILSVTASLLVSALLKLKVVHQQIPVKGLAMIFDLVNETPGQIGRPLMA